MSFEGWPPTSMSDDENFTRCEKYITPQKSREKISNLDPFKILENISLILTL